MPVIADRSFTAIRNAFADVLKGVDGITATYPHEPDGPTTGGAAWPVWIRTEYLTLGPSCATQTDWEVVVVLPGGSKSAAIGESDRLIADVATAIQAAGLGSVSWAEPRVLGAEMGGIPAMAVHVTTATT